MESIANPSGIRIITTTTNSFLSEKNNITKDPQEGNTYLEPKRAKVRRYIIKK